MTELALLRYEACRLWRLETGSWGRTCRDACGTGDNVEGYFAGDSENQRRYLN
jgi:hypothetical protein